MVEEIFDSAESFLAVIRRSHPRWWDAKASTSEWVYRGQADASWKLLPRMCRDGACPFWRFVSTESLSLNRGDGYKGLDEAHKQRWARIEALLMAESAGVRRFSYLADVLGFSLPQSSQTERSKIQIGAAPPDFVSMLNTYKPSNRTALAQHHGIPTRLLDWSEHPLAATFFAVSDSLRLFTDEKRPPIALFVMNGGMFFPLTMIRPHRSINSFMRAQSGLFSWDEYAEYTYLETGEWQDHGQAITAFANKHPKATAPDIYKLVLPGEHVHRLSVLLRREDISLAHLMPSLDNVAKTAIADDMLELVENPDAQGGPIEAAFMRAAFGPRRPPRGG